MLTKLLSDLLDVRHLKEQFDIQGKTLTLISLYVNEKLVCSQRQCKLILGYQLN